MTSRTALSAPVALILVLAACTATPSPSASSVPSQSSAATTSAAPSMSPSASPTAVPATWSVLAPAGAGPAAREDHTWTATPDGATAYLFGGRTAAGGALDDLWAYDLSADTWRQVDAAGPAARFGHNAAWVDGMGLVVFAGQAGSTFFNDLWAFDPATGSWTRLAATGDVPVSRYGSCAAIGPDGRLWISHGFTSEGQRFADTVAYDFTTSAWTDQTPAGDLPVSRCLHGCWWTDTGAFILYAGQTTGVTALGDLWQLTVGPRPGTNAWARVAPFGGLPPDRNLYAAARWGAGTLVFGGQGIDDGLLSDAWWLEDGTGAATLVVAGDSGPAGRYGAEMIADPQRGRVLLFGGTTASLAFGDLWQLTLADR